MKNKTKVLVGMSGGVDSSVSAALLKQQGYEVIGVFMKFWSDNAVNEALNKCCSVEAYMSAKRVAQILNIPLYTFNFENDFKKEIVDDFLSSYQVGLTPNPCVRCNQFIKFGELLKKADELGAEFVATGHYARLGREFSIHSTSSGQVSNFQFPKLKLLKGRDQNKDQSYFLYTLTQEKLKRILFPVGDYEKPEVRKIAEQFNLPVAQKQDSQELCFVGDKEHYGFLQRYLKMQAGDIVTTDGVKVGEHKGLPLYTIGQRKGIEIGGTGPYYVVKLDFKNNNLIVSKNEEDLLTDSLYCQNIHWISGEEPKLPLTCKARVRYRQEESEAIVSRVETQNLASIQIKFKKPQRAIASGQSVVLYDGNEVLGGGVIKDNEL